VIVAIVGLGMLMGVFRLRPWALFGSAACCGGIAALGFVAIWYMVNVAGETVLDLASPKGVGYMLLNVTIFLAIICLGMNSAVGAARKRRS